MLKNKALSSSFKDPSGFIFSKKGVLYRQINKSYFHNYTAMMQSGLYRRLTERGLLTPHQEIKIRSTDKIIKPDLVKFISYPYEWSFSMLKDAALVTLEIQKMAIKYGQTLKDASAFNIQFVNSRPVLIDSLSFETYQPGMPWQAYQQFCRHFLASLALMAFVGPELNQLSRIYLDGVPLGLACRLLPVKTKLNFGLLLHLHLHSHNQNKYSNGKSLKKIKVSQVRMLGLIDSLETTIRKLSWLRPKTEWGNYYSFANYSNRAMKAKKRLVEKFILKTNPKSVWDMGANTGRFSRLASNRGINTIAFDLDPTAVELNYRECRRSQEKNLLPLIIDLTNPSANIGFACKERDSLIKRGPADLVLALALIHHLAISNNLPFNLIAEFFSKCGRSLVIEFVPKQDSQVQKLLASRKDIFPSYSQEEFYTEFSRYFMIIQKKAIPGTKRILYFMRRKG